MNLLKKTPVLSYFAITFFISWGGIFILGYPYGMPSTNEQFQALWTSVVLPFFLGPALAGLLMTAIIGGRAGFRELRDRLLKWRIGLKWYAVALLTAPLIVTPLLFIFSLYSPVFLPGIVTSADKVTTIMTGIVTGVLFGGLMEEMGWTGFAVHVLLKRFSTFKTGLIIGILHGVWHFPVKILISGPLGLSPFLAVDLITAVVNFTAWRILMVWIYNRTGGSLLATMLMHASLTGSTLFILAPAATGGSLVVYNLATAAAVWIVVAAIVLIYHKSKEERI